MGKTREKCFAGFCGLVLLQPRGRQEAHVWGSLLARGAGADCWTPRAWLRVTLGAFAVLCN